MPAMRFRGRRAPETRGSAAARGALQFDETDGEEGGQRAPEQVECVHERSIDRVKVCVFSNARAIAMPRGARAYCCPELVPAAFTWCARCPTRGRHGIARRPGGRPPPPCGAGLGAAFGMRWHATRLFTCREVRSNLHHLQDR